MPSIVVDMDADTKTLVAEKRNAKIKPSLIMIDNVLAGADSELTFNDVFTTSDSVVAATGAAAAGAAQTERRLRINVSTLACVSLRDELKDLIFLGLVQVVRTEAGVATLDANCHITLAYDFE